MTLMEQMPQDDLAQLKEMVVQLQQSNDVLAESFRDLEMDDVNWVRFSAQVEAEFTSTGRQRIVEVCRAMSVANPLIKRGITVRTGYIWGQGVEVNAQVPNNKPLQDRINAAIDDFEDANRGTFTGQPAREELERCLGTDGEVFLALFTQPGGGVQVRLVPQQQIRLIVTNPEDADDQWFYFREYPKAEIPAPNVPLTAPPTQEYRCIYPALGYDDKQISDLIGYKPPQLNGTDVMWDAPLVHVPVNRLSGWLRGIPDVYASAAWARLYQEFMVDWAGLTKALSKIAWRATGESKSRASQMAAVIRAQQVDIAGTLPQPNTNAGQTMAMGPGVSMEAVSKSGATIDAQSGRPLAAMVAAGLGIPVTSLLADPGLGARGVVAQSLDSPTTLEMGMRRLLWQEVMDRIYRQHIESSLKITDDDSYNLEFNWPPLNGADPIQLTQAIVQAASTESLPELTIARLLLGALGVPNVDEVINELTDDKGNFKPPQTAAAAQTNVGQRAADSFRLGHNPQAGDPQQGQAPDQPIS